MNEKLGDNLGSKNSDLMGLTYESFLRDYFAHRNYTFPFMSFSFRGRKLMTTKMALPTLIHI